MNEVFYTINTKGIITYISPSIEKVYGFSQHVITGKHYLDFVPKKDRPGMKSLFDDALAGNYHDGDYRIFDKWGNLRWIQVSVKEMLNKNRTTGLQGIITDVTHRKLLQQRLVLSERLAATGQLAASIAHEINSPLQAITITLSSLKRISSKNQDISDGIDLLKAAFSNISDTVKNLLDLNRKGMEDIRTVDINSIILKTAALVKAHLRQNRIKIVMDLDDKLPTVDISPQNIGQVILNIINNAVDAISGENRDYMNYNRDLEGGIITIKSLFENGMVTVRISDTGTGISPADTEKIFTPFYSTKKGSGMGIGLAICRKIIEEHTGTLTANNSAEKGAVFIIKFPASKDRPT
jgi:PAS domain S-box-containing protein